MIQYVRELHDVKFQRKGIVNFTEADHNINTDTYVCVYYFIPKIIFHEKLAYNCNTIRKLYQSQLCIGDLEFDVGFRSLRSLRKSTLSVSKLLFH